jgi:hypothetical protein
MFLHVAYKFLSYDIVSFPEDNVVQIEVVFTGFSLHSCTDPCTVIKCLINVVLFFIFL